VRVTAAGREVWRHSDVIDSAETSYSGGVVDEDGAIVVCGSIGRFNEVANMVQPVGVVVRIWGEENAPRFIRWAPEDFALQVLTGTEIEFIAVADDPDNDVIEYTWRHGVEPLDGDTSVSILFDEAGIDTVLVTASDGALTRQLTWHVTVADLYIADFTPDTLNLAIRRGTSVDFSLDTIRFTDGADPEILWTKTNLANGQTENAGTESRATIDFPWSGEYEVEGRVSRGESSDAVTWHVKVRGAIWAYVPLADSLEVQADSVVHFEVVPSAPEDESLTIQWFVDGERVLEGEVALEWAFCTVDNCRRYLVQVVVADSVEADTVEWVVTVSDLSTPRDPAADPPRSAAILSVSPNPFNSMLTIRFQSVKSVQSVVNINIYDIFGREVFSVASQRTNGKITPPTPPTIVGGDSQTLIWDAFSQPAGVYFVRLQSGREVSTKKVVLMR